MLDMKSDIDCSQAMAMRLSDQFRQAVGTSCMSGYRMCKELGNDQASMRRIMAGAGMASATNDGLAEYSGLKIKHPAKRRTAWRMRNHALTDR